MSNTSINELTTLTSDQLCSVLNDSGYFEVLIDESVFLKVNEQEQAMYRISFYDDHTDTTETAIVYVEETESGNITADF